MIINQYGLIEPQQWVIAFSTGIILLTHSKSQLFISRIQLFGDNTIIIEK